MTTKSTNLDSGTEKWLEKLFPSVYIGLRTSAQSFLIIRQLARKELAENKLFTREELIAITDSFNGIEFEPQFAQRGPLLAEMQDFEALENGISRHDANPDELYEKIKGMSDIHAFFLIFEVKQFWKENGSGSTDLNAFLGEFAR